jgi:hypothetical protein
MHTLKAIIAWFRYWWVFLWIAFLVAMIPLAAWINTGGPQ